MNNIDLVSVIMPTYNSGKYLADSINSVLAQTYYNIELLITDDCSTDVETLQILKDAAANDSRVKVVYLSQNHGAGYARNCSIERAIGRYIAFCDSDDRWMPNKLEMQIEAMRQHKCALCSSSYIICDCEDNNIGVNITPEFITYEMMKRDNKIGCLTAVYDTTLLGKKYYMPNIRKRQDWGLFLNITHDCRKAYGIKQPLAYYRKRKGSISSNKMSLVKYNIGVYHDCLHYNMIKSYAYFTFCFLPTYATKVLKQKLDSYLLKREYLSVK